MIVDPVLPAWALALVGAALAAFAVWRFVAQRRAGRPALLWLARLAMVALVVAVALRPAIPTDGQGPRASGGLEVYVAVDTTSSMAAEDWAYGRPRLDGVKADLAQIVGSLEGAQFSLVTFDAVPVQRVPLTTDSTAMLSAVDVLQQEITTYSRGSSIDVAVAFLDGLLAQAEELNPDQRRVLFYLGDGEQTLGSPPGSFEVLAPYLSGGAVLGYGTDTGGPMREYFGESPTQFGDTANPQPVEPQPEQQPPSYIQDPTTGSDALSRLDGPALETVAQQLGVQYLRRAADSPVAPATTGLSVGALTVDPGEPDAAVELYWVFAIPLGLLALLELSAAGALLLDLRPARTRRNP